MAEITRDQLLTKLEALRLQRDQAIANANACGGGMTVLEQLVADLEREPTTATAEVAAIPTEGEPTT